MTTFILTYRERQRSPIAILVSFRGKMRLTNVCRRTGINADIKEVQGIR